MKNTQQQLVIDDFNYCDTICDDTEAIVGGRNLWNAIKGTVQDKVSAIKTTATNLFTGKITYRANSNRFARAA